MAENYVLLERVELNATTSTVTFLNIPQTGYTDLKLVCSSRATNNNGQYVAVQINGLTGNISARTLYGSNTTASSYSSSGQTVAYGDQPDSNFTANVFANTEFYITNYNSASQYKTISMDGVTEGNSTSAWQIEMGARLSSNNAAVTDLTLTVPNAGSFAQYSSFSLYGLAAVGTTPTTPQAQGGDIVVSDGTYWYHAFKSSGTFIANTNLACSVLQVAGGGAGFYGGGGAGGLLYTSSRTFNTGSYTVTIGAGGAAPSPNAGQIPVSGNDSSITGIGFSTLTAIAGGGGGVYPTLPAGATGANGGSGGGAGVITSGVNASGGTATSGQGNAGGTNNNQSTNSAAGGGGAGAVGSNANSGSYGGAGGAGVNTYSSWATATSTGDSGYYAGGGGGRGFTTPQAAGGLGGGGKGDVGGSTAAGSAGSANTGGGGGGGYGTVPNGYAGGSGITIIRYAV